MDWIKIPIDEVLFSDRKDWQSYALIKYQAVFCQLEREPNDAQLSKFLNKKEIEWIRSDIEAMSKWCQSHIEKVKLKRKSDKEYYKRKQCDSENSVYGKFTESLRTERADKIREDKIIEDNINPLISPFEKFWVTFPKKRIGNKEKSFQAYSKALKEKRGTMEGIQDGAERYAKSDEVRRGFAKGCAAWLNDDRWNSDYSDNTTQGISSGGEASYMDRIKAGVLKAAQESDW